MQHRSSFRRLQYSSLRGRYVTTKIAGTPQKCTMCFPVLVSRLSRDEAKVAAVVENVRGEPCEKFRSSELAWKSVASIELQWAGLASCSPFWAYGMHSE